MSTTLYWQPAKPPDWEPVDKGNLKSAIGRRYGDHDGSLRLDPVTMTEEDIPWLQGVKDSLSRDSDTEQGAQHLINAIQKHGIIEVRIG